MAMNIGDFLLLDDGPKDCHSERGEAIPVAVPRRQLFAPFELAAYPVSSKRIAPPAPQQRDRTRRPPIDPGRRFKQRLFPFGAGTGS
jgi:hypothetical protein